MSVDSLLFTFDSLSILLFIVNSSVNSCLEENL